MDTGKRETLLSLRLRDIQWKAEQEFQNNPTRLYRAIAALSGKTRKHTARSSYVLGVLCLLEGNVGSVDKVLDVFGKYFPTSVEYSLLVAHVWDCYGDRRITYLALEEARGRCTDQEESDAVISALRDFFTKHGRAMAAKEGFRTDYDDETREGVVVSLGAYRRAKKGAI